MSVAIYAPPSGWLYISLLVPVVASNGGRHRSTSTTTKETDVLKSTEAACRREPRNASHRRFAVVDYKCFTTLKAAELMKYHSTKD